MKDKEIKFTIKKNKEAENIGMMQIKNLNENEAELYIYGDIVSSAWNKWDLEDTCPQDIVDFLSGIKENANLTLYINSGGGDVFAGIGIYNILKRHKGKIKGIVDGIAASIASVILMACDEIVVSTGAQIMIHKPMTIGWGNADELMSVVEQLDKCQEMITDIYMQKAKDGVTKEEITTAINNETWMSGSEAAEMFDITAEDHAAIAACTSCMVSKYAHAPVLETASVDDTIICRRKQKNDKETLKEILDDLFMYGA